MTQSMANRTTKFYSEFLSNDVYIHGAESLENSSINKLFICLDSELAEYLSKVIGNLKACCVISFSDDFEDSFKLTADTLKSHSAFLAIELQPYLQSLTKTPLTSILVGQQFNAILAAYTATSYENTFQAVLSLSGSYYWKPQTEKKWEWFTQWLAGETHCPLNMYLLSSIHETLQPPRTVPTARMANQHLYNVLQAKRCNAMLHEFSATKLSQDFFDELQNGCQWLIDRLDNTS